MHAWLELADEVFEGVGDAFEGAEFVVFEVDGSRFVVDDDEEALVGAGSQRDVFERAVVGVLVAGGADVELFELPSGGATKKFVVLIF
ncbi:hypothetical protein [Tumebacillus flagellatus]|uniref:hypothetical protein n=1 Tax=Tumebacillus flagellatus TaxID=1157490 RepID=UPI001EE650E2|nr:hypothetical protein [Tumebacillus flagellatus]